MIRLWLVFFVIFALFYVGIPTFHALTGREKWAVTKVALYSLLCSLFAVGTMILIVILF
jgi:hypothetical protein